jgi:hypothetical protein
MYKRSNKQITEISNRRFNTGDESDIAAEKNLSMSVLLS